MSAWVLRAVVLLLVLASYWGIYQHGRSVERAEWQARWNARDAGDKQAWALGEAAERDKEQAYQRSVTKAVQDGQRKIDQAAADVVTARAAADSLRGAADTLAARLAASQAGGNSCTAAASAAATRAVMVLADVLKKSVRRNTELAETADSAIARGGVCEAAYSALQTK